MSVVCLPVCVKRLVSQWTDFVIFFSEKFYENFVEKNLNCVIIGQKYEPP
jgi:hypothetical protein